MNDNNKYPSAEQFAVMSDNQKRFVKLARRQKLAMREYSGRCMYGAVCPAVVVSPWDGVKFARTITTSQDNMGKDIVIYAGS